MNLFADVSVGKYCIFDRYKITMQFNYSRRLIILMILVFTSFYSCKENQESEKTVEHKFTNALVDETSPYLLQHAHNPVNWRPWSQNALDDAKKEDKLVLVSIGYSSCHWCHVMEEETFEDEEVAKVMNENFINIKVDREERPDVDQIYMTALQLISGNGGWPLNVITLPNGKPLYGGTYHTKEQWTQVLTKINELYRNDPDKAAEYADMVAGGIAETNLIQPSSDFSLLSKEALNHSVEKWRANWDLEKGGDTGSQKFMIPSNLSFLLDYAALSEDEQAKAHVENSLDQMALGGINDHIGGGFYRYSVDSEWKVPHFEKMLYDNAQALSLYSKAYTIFKKMEYKNVVWETIDFLKNEMKNNSGGYYAALNADSDGEEGKFYVWKQEELKTILGDGFNLFASYYDIADDTVWEDGNHVLRRIMSDSDFIAQNEITGNVLNAAKSEWKKKLMKARAKRTRPSTDDKIITSWNALLITGLVDAYKAFGQKSFLSEAENIFQYLKKNSYQNESLVHTYKKGSQQKEGFLEDYSFLAKAALQLYTVTFKTEYLDFARKLTGLVEIRFHDEASGMYRYNKGDELIAKIIKTDDGVLPSPNAVMAHNLFELGHIDYNTNYTEKSKKMISAMVPMIKESAPSYSKWNALLLQNIFPYFEVAVVGDASNLLVASLNEKHLPNTLVVGSTSSSELPLLKDRYVEGDTYIYVCQNTTCKLPVSTVQQAIEQMADF
ncbi:thioredoxin domain-containing protein [Pseudozobellia sp. WGM2]|uniref:thioredoxin domain-containing protein n=1 Tax=Pseudozobellia sp. WGM2 TaxID=2787625 RepID=UPI001FD7632D|nr:thioredoxin domain-containing protein [Pseudozobellia sp. WGM2]